MPSTVTTQVLLELSRSRVEMEIATEIVGFAVAEVVKLDLVDVGTIGSLCGVNFALFDELLNVIFLTVFYCAVWSQASVSRPTTATWGMPIRLI